MSIGDVYIWTFRGKREISDNGSHLWSKTKIRDGVVYNLNREHVLLQLLEETLNQEQKKLLENYLRLAEGNLPLNQLYVDLNNEEQVNVRKEKDAEREAIETVETILANISDSPMRDAQIRLIMQTDPFCNYRNIVDMLAKELDS